MQERKMPYGPRVAYFLVSALLLVVIVMYVRANYIKADLWHAEQDRDYSREEIAVKQKQIDRLKEENELLSRRRFEVVVGSVEKAEVEPAQVLRDALIKRYGVKSDVVNDIIAIKYNTTDQYLYVRTRYTADERDAINAVMHAVSQTMLGLDVSDRYPIKRYVAISVNGVEI